VAGLNGPATAHSPEGQSATRRNASLAANMLESLD